MVKYIITDWLNNPLNNKTYSSLTEAREGAYNYILRHDVYVVEIMQVEARGKRIFKGTVKFDDSYTAEFVWSPFIKSEKTDKYYLLNKNGSIGKVLLKGHFYKK